MPFSYQGFGFTAILLMMLVLAAVEGVKYLKEKFHRNSVKQNQRGH